MAADRDAMREKRLKRQIARTEKYFDFTLLFIVIFLVCFGLVMIYSTSSYSAANEEGDALYYLKRQAIFTGGGFIAIFIITRFDYHFWTRFAFLAYVISIIMQTQQEIM